MTKVPLKNGTPEGYQNPGTWEGGITKGDSSEMPESVFRVSEKTLTKLISEF